MIAGELYRPGDPKLVEDRKRAQALMAEYNATTYASPERHEVLARLIGRCGDRLAVRAPFYVDYGFNITFGSDVFLNYGCVFLDVCPISVGDMTQIGPYVQVLTADHPRDAATRDAGLEFGQPIVIGRNVWIGGGAMILPGVTIGDDAVVGAGSVLTRDIAAGSTVGGAPARPLRSAKH